MRNAAKAIQDYLDAQRDRLPQAVIPFQPTPDIVEGYSLMFAETALGFAAHRDAPEAIRLACRYIEPLGLDMRPVGNVLASVMASEIVGTPMRAVQQEVLRDGALHLCYFLMDGGYSKAEATKHAAVVCQALGFDVPKASTLDKKGNRPSGKRPACIAGRIITDAFGGKTGLIEPADAFGKPIEATGDVSDAFGNPIPHVRMEAYSTGEGKKAYRFRAVLADAEKALHEAFSDQIGERR